MLLASKLPEQREQNSRYHSHNGLRFFAGYAAKKWPPFGAAEAVFQELGLDAKDRQNIFQIRQLNA